jgi:hypothetical protein
MVKMVVVVYDILRKKEEEKKNNGGFFIQCPMLPLITERVCLLTALEIEKTEMSAEIRISTISKVWMPNV